MRNIQSVFLVVRTSPVVMSARNYSSLYTGTDPDTGDEVSKELRCDIISVTSNTAVVVRANRNVPPSLRSGHHELADGAPGFGGLSHLEGRAVNILSDANVEPQKVVSGGAVTLESPGASAHRPANNC